MVPKRLLNYVLCRRDERILVEIKARDRSRIGDSAPQYCGATKRSVERRRRRQDDVFQQSPKGRLRGGRRPFE